jgi:hypothetical protein
MLLTPVPDNMRLPRGAVLGNTHVVEGDVFNICERIKDIHPDLFVVLQEGHDRPWVVMERCTDGVERMVSRYEELDARILEDLRYMLAVPFEERYRRVADRIDRENKQREQVSDEWIERFAWDFQRALVDANMSDPVWGRSYRPTKHKRG